MYKFMIVFKQPEQLSDHAFEHAYQDLLALVERMPFIQRRQVVHVMGSPAGASPYFRILEVYYPDRATLEKSLMSPQGQEAGNEMRRFPAESFEMIFAEVYEEDGGQTPTGADVNASA